MPLWAQAGPVPASENGEKTESVKHGRFLTKCQREKHRAACHQSAESGRIETRS